MAEAVLAAYREALARRDVPLRRRGDAAAHLVNEA